MATLSPSPLPEPVPGWRRAVRNQVDPLEGVDLYAENRPLVEAVAREEADWADPALRELGARAGDPETQAWAEQANEHPPVLHTHDRLGRRRDEVVYHPAYHELMRLAVGHGLHAGPWRDPRPGAHVARAAGFMTTGQVEAGHGCPISMTYSAVPALRVDPGLAAEWEPRLTSLAYDPVLRPAADKPGAICGMAMTEKQGGSDVRANETEARPLQADGEYELFGHKWFCSAPMSDVFLTLAHLEEGLTCFLLPRVLPDASRNALHFQRLKDKLGNRSNASSEVEYDGAWARRLGEPGRGVATIIEMVAHTRLDCVLGSAAGMRAGVAQATHHAAHRAAFGQRLADQPLMRNVLADLCLESEAATLLAVRLAAAYDRAGEDPREAAYRRVATAIAKYWVCKRAPGHAAEALECLGGNGYVEASGLPRLLRESPLNSIWEGSGNVQCLDVLRALSRTPEALGILLDEVREAAAAEPRLERHLRRVEREWGDPATLELRARRVVEGLALALQAALMVRHASPTAADLFCASRLEGDGGLAYGTLPAADPEALAALVERHRPQVA